ncbi:MAG: lytic transglycosylase domain-containing protein [Deltaproteobacteria bacterium]|nr:lytic transglycosylase domain-containing protein [Deltaproteobacteria bacterium]
MRVSLGLAPARRHEAPRAAEAGWWRLAYPWGFAEEVSRAAAREGRAASWLLSFIRKESAFAPRARSPAQALGLMQLLPKTAQAIAAWAPPEAPPEALIEGLPEALPEALYDPGTNVLLGARYLRALGARYHEQLPLVALAYNAGPAALGGWLRAAREEQGLARLDLFVERVPFKEARGYVKRVAQGVCLYELLYGELSLNACAGRLPLSLTLEAREGVGF